MIYKYSNPPQVYRLASKYLGKKAKIGLSTKKNKKYMVTIKNILEQRNIFLNFYKN